MPVQDQLGDEPGKSEAAAQLLKAVQDLYLEGATPRVRVLQWKLGWRGRAQWTVSDIHVAVADLGPDVAEMSPPGARKGCVVVLSSASVPKGFCGFVDGDFEEPDQHLLLEALPLISAGSWQMLAMSGLRRPV